MKEKIEIQEVRSYDNEKGSGTIVKYVFVDPKFKVSNKKVKGHTVMTDFFKPELFNEFPDNFIRKSLIATIVSEPSTSNPLRTNQIISNIEYMNDSLDLSKYR